MKFVALLRGINVGGKHQVTMTELKHLFETLGFHSVSTYINSGNVKFSSPLSPPVIRQKLELNFKLAFGFNIPTLVKTEKEMLAIVKAIPKTWENNSLQKSDIAYLFPEIDTPNTVSQLPLNPNYVDIRYIKGAILWNIKRINYGRSHLNKLAGHKLYKFMTIRNLNTAKALCV